MRQKRGDGGGGLGRAIRVVRTQQGVNRKELAGLSGLSYPYLAEIESGRKTPSSRALRQIAVALDMAPHELMEAAETMSQATDASWFSPGHSYFLKRSEPAPSAAAFAPPSAEGGATEDLVQELAAAARRLSPEDLRRLIGLARRLGRDTAES